MRPRRLYSGCLPLAPTSLLLSHGTGALPDSVQLGVAVWPCGCCGPQGLSRSFKSEFPAETSNRGWPSEPLLSPSPGPRGTGSASGT